MAESGIPTEVKVNIVPTELVLRHQADHWSEDRAKTLASEEKIEKATYMLWKTELEVRIKKLEPQVRDKQAEHANIEKDILQTAKDVIADLKVSDEFEDVKKALRKLKISGVNCSISMGEVDIDLGIIHFIRSIDGGSRGYGASLSGADRMKFTAEMKDMRHQWQTLRDEIKELDAQLLEARHQLDERANAMADIQGRNAVKSLTTEEAERTKAIFEDMKQGTSGAKLLVGAKT
jgi:hypothetical protein